MDRYENNLRLVEAKLGSANSQMILYKHFEELTKPIKLKYEGLFTNKLGIYASDLDGICNECFESLLTLEECPYNIDNFFKYIYVKRINWYLRRSFHCNYNLNMQDGDYCEMINNDYLSENDYFDKTFDIKDELLTEILESDKVKLKNIDKTILKLYINDYTISEIAKILDFSYTAIFRRIERILRKCKIFLLENFKDYC